MCIPSSPRWNNWIFFLRESVNTINRKLDIIIPESETTESESDKEKFNFGNINQKRNESQDFFTENAIPNKKNKLSEVVEKDDPNATYCCSPSYENKQEHEFSQYSQRWFSPDYTDQEHKKSSPNSEKQFSDVAVMTTGPQNYVDEINENIRISNLMFCKFISHELDR